MRGARRPGMKPARRFFAAMTMCGALCAVASAVLSGVIFVSVPFMYHSFLPALSARVKPALSRGPAGALIRTNDPLAGEKVGREIVALWSARPAVESYEPMGRPVRNLPANGGNASPALN